MDEFIPQFQQHFQKVNDPRQAHKVRHPLIEIITISFLAILCGADDWTEVELFATAREDWLREFLELPSGIPSHDTFSRVFSLIDPVEFEAGFSSFMQAICQLTHREVVPIDGKTLRGSHDRKNDQKALHMVSAWATRNQMVFGQLATDKKSNEITAIPELLRLLKVKDCIVTIDAMGTQKEIVQVIRERKADFVLCLKENHPLFYERVVAHFDQCVNTDFAGVEVSRFDSSEKNHGRLEDRAYYQVKVPADWEGLEEWQDLRTLGLVIRRREIQGKEAWESHYYISSLDLDAGLFAHAVRSHWGIENKLHWSLDVTFREDASRKRVGHSAQNFSVMTRLGLNLLRKETTLKRGLKAKRLRAALDSKYLLKLLQ